MARTFAEYMSDRQKASAPAAVKGSEDGFLPRLGDVGVDVLKTGVGIGRTAKGLAGFATGGVSDSIGNALGEVTGGSFDKADKALSDLYSPERQEEEQHFQQAKGFVDSAKALISEPAVGLGHAIQSLPYMVPAAKAARLAGAAATKAALAKGATAAAAKKTGSRAATIAASATEGAVSAGQSFEELEKENLRERYAGATLGGVGTAALGVGIGTLGKKIGLGDVDAAINATGSKAVQVLKSMGQEGLEEAPQSAVETMANNFAQGKPLMEGVPKAVATGLVVGAGTGGAFGAVNASGEPSAPSDSLSLSVRRGLAIKRGRLDEGNFTDKEKAEIIKGEKEQSKKVVAASRNMRQARKKADALLLKAKKAKGPEAVELRKQARKEIADAVEQNRIENGIISDEGGIKDTKTDAEFDMGFLSQEALSNTPEEAEGIGPVREYLQELSDPSKEVTLEDGTRAVFNEPTEDLGEVEAGLMETAPDVSPSELQLDESVQEDIQEEQEEVINEQEDAPIEEQDDGLRMSEGQVESRRDEGQEGQTAGELVGDAEEDGARVEERGGDDSVSEVEDALDTAIANNEDIGKDLIDAAKGAVYPPSLQKYVPIINSGAASSPENKAHYIEQIETQREDFPVEAQRLIDRINAQASQTDQVDVSVDSEPLPFPGNKVVEDEESYEPLLAQVRENASKFTGHYGGKEMAPAAQEYVETYIKLRRKLNEEEHRAIAEKFDLPYETILLFEGHGGFGFGKIHDQALRGKKSAQKFLREGVVSPDGMTNQEVNDKIDSSPGDAKVSLQKELQKRRGVNRFNDGVVGFSHESDVKASPNVAVMEARFTRLRNKVMKNNPEIENVVFARSLKDLPEWAEATYNESDKDNSGLAGLKGAYIHNRETGKVVVVLNRNKFSSSTEVEKTMLHELAGHFGMDKLLGSKGYTHLLHRVIRTNKHMVKEAYALRERWTNIKTDPVDGQPTYTIKVDGKSIVVDGKGMQSLVDELIAETAKQWIDPKHRAKMDPAQRNYFQRIISWIRHKLNGTFSNVRDEDIAELLAQSHQTVFEGMSVDNVQQNIQGSDVSLEKVKVETDAVNTASDGSGATSINRNEDIVKLSEKTRMDKWRGLVDKGADWLEHQKGTEWIQPMGHMKGKSVYDKTQMIPRGDIGRFDNQAKDFAHILNKKYKNPFGRFEKLSLAQKDMVYDFFTTKGAVLNENALPKEVVNASMKAKDSIIELQKRLVKVEIFTKNSKGKKLKKSIDESQGSYLPRLYLDYLHSGSYKGTGKRASATDYLRAKDEKGETELVVKGEVRDPGIVVADALGTLGRDVPLFEMMGNMQQANIENPEFDWFHSPTKRYAIGNKRFDYGRILDEIADTRAILAVDPEDIRLRQTPEGIEATKEYMRELEIGKGVLEQDVLNTARQSVADDLGIEEGATTDEMVKEYLDKKYVKSSYKDRWLGPLRGSYIHKEIYNDLIDTTKELDKRNLDLVSKSMMPGGSLEKWTQWWKLTKVAWNLASWVRNTLGNAALLDLATPTNSIKLTKMLAEEVNALMGKGDTTWKREAERYGLLSTTFSANELHRIERDFQKSYKRNLSEETGENKTPIRAMWAMQDFMYSIGEATSKYHGVVEGLFKTVAMRDYVNRWEANTGNKLSDMNGPERDALLAEAVSFGHETLFDYSKVPRWLRSFRRTPLGSPFFTFIYKAFPAVIKGTMKHPQKMIKYYTAPYLLAQAMMAAGGMDEDDYKDAMKKLPSYMAEKSSLFVFPIKDENGKLSYKDMSYIYPWAQFVDMGTRLKNGARDGNFTSAAADLFLRDLGVFSGPIPQMMSALLVNKDPFTQREIVNESATAEEQYKQRFIYMWNMAVPPFMSEHGIMARMAKQGLGQNLSKLGTEKANPYQSFSSGLGLTMGKFDPAEGAAQNVRRFAYEQKKVKSYYRKQILDPNTSPTKRAGLVQNMRSQLKKIQERRTDYLSRGF